MTCLKFAITDNICYNIAEAAAVAQTDRAFAS